MYTRDLVLVLAGLVIGAICGSLWTFYQARYWSQSHAFRCKNWLKKHYYLHPDGIRRFIQGKGYLEARGLPFEHWEPVELLRKSAPDLQESTMWRVRFCRDLYEIHLPLEFLVTRIP